ncbi:hypothetical protein AVI51_16445 (plasmid) [Piscirickettsia salmonis]|uniref:Uncharacterized protein n=1 Tax=Piscirickettsia salmonis TaxID=1238 RepID=A0A9Q6PYS9_PISSA|nr:hypothetical protein [Piscirickettsia salmonis]ALA26748.1 3-deoxy-manno-octulosonate cytidylyltransferase [Piscirickettsia salmonis]APS49416.1 hypothetical protein AVI49_17345 [Piscirickettsia salmonis]APS52525.1 hypothetical protein AVI50_16880 [Piscirickettsia salmonis]APS55692.1 hypothetical protein AVI51_16445 [Piscirickettsia salmonis]APS59026.1 hypothetical protein AVI52_17440 [Piscirickettsia salmonis]
MKNYFERLQVIADDRIAIDDCYALASEMLGTHQDKKGRIERIFCSRIEEGLMDGLSYTAILINVREGLFELFQRRLV